MFTDVDQNRREPLHKIHSEQKKKRKKKRNEKGNQINNPLKTNLKEHLSIPNKT